jgi:hypothetical protein
MMKLNSTGNESASSCFDNRSGSLDKIFANNKDYEQICIQIKDEARDKPITILESKSSS